MEQQQSKAIESILAHINLRLELLDSNIAVCRKNSGDLKASVVSYNDLKQKEAKLRKERNRLQKHLEFLVDMFKQQNEGNFPDGMYPLFSQEQATASGRPS